MPSVTTILALGMATIALAAPIDTLQPNIAVARDNIAAREAYIYTQEEEKRDLDAREAYIYTQEEEKRDIGAREAYIYTQEEEKRDLDAREAYIYTQEEE
ncbi:hypothetical protein CKM354_000665400 [Cercospora kikuchii]|uniref:Uncharacterized protein n=1 Tax=Cercospora kikuchii TaxID=84275 RepID=A0A9P3FDI7_9PEZI|nr:uncharacterized protein CKM354_000665400 [Cercospora kikuchii]GIZ43426.1 hypothetical protein CKM354_000665400 [Cercospora kikuchii]